MAQTNDTPSKAVKSIYHYDSRSFKPYYC